MKKEPVMLSFSSQTEQVSESNCKALATLSLYQADLTKQHLLTKYIVVAATEKVLQNRIVLDGAELKIDEFIPHFETGKYTLDAFVSGFDREPFVVRAQASATAASQRTSMPRQFISF